MKDNGEEVLPKKHRQAGEIEEVRVTVAVCKPLMKVTNTKIF